MRPDELVQELESRREQLSRIAGRVARELEGLTQREQIHFIAWRVKTPESLRGKLLRPDKTYRQLWDVTDLVGVRVATYFEDALDDVARQVEARYLVDYRHSVDKLRFTDHGRFGYRSLHYVCALPDDEAPHPGFRFEIQLRTALQHAWAEVEHDLGYKSSDAVPEQIRRRFSRIASLLEIADQEFVSIRRDLRGYQQAVQQALEQSGRSLPLDILTLASLAHDARVTPLDEAIARALGKPLSSEVFFPDYLLRMLRLAGLATTDAALAAIERHGGEVGGLVGPYFDFARRAFGLEPGSLDAVLRGYGLFFVAYLSILRGDELGLSKAARLTRMFHELDYPGDERRAHQLASELLRDLG